MQIIRPNFSKGVDQMNNIQSRKLKLNKKFLLPCHDDGDEFYPNGIFEFNITKLVAFIRANPNKFPIEEVEVASLLPSSHLNELTIKTADLANPIILAEISPGRFNVIDGNHRLERARRGGRNAIPAFKVRPEYHIAFLTSEKACKVYVEYWNSKINDMEP